MEKWKDIKGYEGLYKVSNLGRVKSLERFDRIGRKIEGKILKAIKDKGYLFVHLYKDKTKKKCRIHRLVAETFIPNPLNKETVNHKDENKENNNVENLEWMTVSENLNYGTHYERMAKTKSKPIYGINMETGGILEYSSAMDAEKSGFNNSHIISCCKGKRRYHKGFKWFYKNF